MRWYKRVLDYLWDVIKIGGLWVLIGIVPFIADMIEDYTRNLIEIPITVHALIFVVCFGWANYRIYEKRYHHRLQIELLSEWVSFLPRAEPDPSNTRIIELVSPQIVMIVAKLKINNVAPEPANILFIVDSVDSDIEVGSAFKGAEIDIRTSVVEKPGNPLFLPGGAIIPDCELKAVIPIEVSPRGPFAAIARLTKMSVQFGVEQSGKKMYLLEPIEVDVSEYHQKLEEILKQDVVVQAQKKGGVMPNSLYQLEVYWRNSRLENISKGPVG